MPEREDPSRQGLVALPRAQFVVSVDTECDKGAGWRVRQPLGFRSSTLAIDQCLEPLLAELGAPATYLISAEVMRDPASRAALERARTRGAELGCHLHGEFIDPGRNDATPATQTMQSSYPPAVEQEKLYNLTQLFAETFGERPRTFRAGRFGVGVHSLGILSELGYTVDSSVAPSCRWSDDGGRVDFWDCPVRPYHPSASDPLRPGRLPILEVPLTIGATRWRRRLERLVRLVVPAGAARARAVAAFGRLSPHFKPVWLRPTWHTVEEMSWLMRSVRTTLAGRAPVFVLMIHSGEAVPGCSPYNRTAEEAASFLARLRGILEYAVTFPVDFVRLSAVREAQGPGDGRSGAYRGAARGGAAGWPPEPNDSTSSASGG